MNVVGILLAAGSANRMGFDKLVTPLCGKSALARSMDALVQGGCDGLVFVTSPATCAVVDKLDCPVPYCVVEGGETRTDSVRNGLAAADGTIAVIHDAARCFVAPELVSACIESAKAFGSGVASLPVTDTVLQTDGQTLVPLDRTTLVRMQTPQAFAYDRIRAAYAAAKAPATDDATLYLCAYGAPRLVMGSEQNRKLTTPADWDWAVRQCCTKFGTGYDVHRLVAGRRLCLGGVEIPFEKGLLGHSDADVLLHALMDALLGACALGDIGKVFPDTDDAYLGADSRVLLRQVTGMVQKRDMTIVHLDATVVCERPKLAPYLPLMRERIAADCSIPIDAVSLKATTTEGMHDEGRGRCISAQAIATVAGQQKEYGR